MNRENVSYRLMMGGNCSDVPTTKAIEECTKDFTKCVCVCVCVRACVRACVYMSVCTCLCVHVCVAICVFFRSCVYVEALLCFFGLCVVLFLCIFSYSTVVLQEGDLGFPIQKFTLKPASQLHPDTLAVLVRYN